MPLYTAFLRAYEPIGAFPAAEQRWWRAYVDGGHGLDRASAAEFEHRVAIRALMAVPPRPEIDLEGAAIVRVEDGVPFVCPLDLRLRCWEALVEFTSLLPDPVAEAFIPSTTVAGALAAYDDWQRSHPDVRPHVLTSRWEIPLKWFVPFEPAERRLSLGSQADRHAAVEAAAPARTRGLVYVTAMSRARRRVARSLAVLRRTMESGAVLQSVEELGRWLEEFHPHSLVELDYGGLVHLVDDGTLRDDESVADVAESVAALGGGDIEQAGAAYERAITRWRAISAGESAN